MRVGAAWRARDDVVVVSAPEAFVFEEDAIVDRLVKSLCGDLVEHPVRKALRGEIASRNLLEDESICGNVLLIHQGLSRTSVGPVGSKVTSGHPTYSAHSISVALSFFSVLFDFTPNIHYGVIFFR